jgi:linearmycin/streptolysin S transport system ATP-binding protein
MRLLEAANLRKSFGSTVAVDGLSFFVDAGEIFGLVGPNGAGKSTTMMMLAGLRQADSGTVTIAGYSPSQRSHELQMMLGVVPQDLAIYGDLTAAENLDFFGRIYGVQGAELERRIGRILTETGLAAHAHQYVRTFSGGMKRRLNFGVALVHDPRFVILDEPTVGVDPQSRFHILDLIRHLAADGVGVIYASHYMEEVEAMCHRVAIVDKGRMLACGTLDELVDRSHADLYVRTAKAGPEIQKQLTALADSVEATDDGLLIIIKRDPKTLPGVVSSRLEALLHRLRELQVDLLSIETREHNLERLFIELTGRGLRD